MPDDLEDSLPHPNMWQTPKPEIQRDGSIRERGHGLRFFDEEVKRRSEQFFDELKFRNGDPVGVPRRTFTDIKVGSSLWNLEPGFYDCVVEDHNGTLFAQLAPEPTHRVQVMRVSPQHDRSRTRNEVRDAVPIPAQPKETSMPYTGDELPSDQEASLKPFVQTTVTKNHRIELNGTQLVALLNGNLAMRHAAIDGDLPKDTEVKITIPSGGDYSGMTLDIDNSCPILVTWTTKELG